MDNNDPTDDLRRRAETTLKKKFGDLDHVPTLAPEGLRGLVHELHVHQIELEMQNKELHEAQSALQEAHDKYLDLYDYAPVGFITADIKGVVHEANLTATHLLGVDRVFLIGKPIFLFVLKEDADTCFLKFRQMFKTHEKQTFELRLIKKNGDQFYAQLQGIVLEPNDGGSAFARLALSNITERKRLDAALERERKQAQMYLDIAGVMLVALNKEGAITMINRKGREILGYREEEIINRNWFDVCLPEELREEVKGVFDKLMAGNIAAVEYYENPVLTRDGEQRIISFHNTVVYDSSHRIVGILFSGEDITDSERAKTEKDRLLDELQNALAQVKRLSGFLPICASCKKIRDDEGYWHHVEEYVSSHSEALFSHGLCPDCIRKLYPEIADEVLGRLEKK